MSSSRDLITRNLQDQSGNFGIPSLVASVPGSKQFVNARTGEVINRGLLPDAYELNGSPLDNSFQLDPQGYGISKALWEQTGVPTNLSTMYGAITAVTSKDTGISARELFPNNVPSSQLLENINFFRTTHSQIGYNSQQAAPPYLNNLMLGTKILTQTI